MSVQRLTVNELVEKAIEEAPDYNSQELHKKASSNKVFDLANELDKMAEQLQSKEQSSLTEFKFEKNAKLTAMENIIDTYIELES